MSTTMVINPHEGALKLLKPTPTVLYEKNKTWQILRNPQPPKAKHAVKFYQTPFVPPPWPGGEGSAFS